MLEIMLLMALTITWTTLFEMACTKKLTTSWGVTLKKDHIFIAHALCMRHIYIALTLHLHCIQITFT